MTGIEGFAPFVGEHCETNTSGNLLKHAGLELSEPMLYGLGEGLAFGVFAFRNMPAPFIGGRRRGEEITQNLARHLGLEVEYRQTRSKRKAWENVVEFVDAGQLVGVKLNMRFLDYYTSGVDFAGHYVAVYGYDDVSVYVVDTGQLGGPMVTGRDSFEEGRLWKGPMASNALTWTIGVSNTGIDWSAVLVEAITANAKAYLNPPMSNFGARGIRKTARMVLGWSDAYRPEAIAEIGLLMERGGTGGGLFRYFYRDFLKEASQHLHDPRLEESAEQFDKAGRLWTEVAGHFGATADGGTGALHAAAEVLLRLADIEERAITTLSGLGKPRL